MSAFFMPEIGLKNKLEAKKKPATLVTGHSKRGEAINFVKYQQGQLIRETRHIILTQNKK
jgi:hypothetical protein